LADALGQRVQQRAHRRDVGLDPAGTVDRLDYRQLLARGKPGICAHARGEPLGKWLHPVRVCTEVGAAAGEHLADPLRHVPVDAVHS
jgi:hypothetical protein